MKTLASWAPAPNLTVVAVEPGQPAWIVSVDCHGAELDSPRACCPVCGTQSGSRHSTYIRTLGDLSAQGAPVSIHARMTRWRCRNDQCDRRIFAERLPALATPFARRTTRLAEIVRLFGHSAGGRPSERLMARLGMPVSDTTILRCLKKGVAVPPDRAVVRVVGVDEWAKLAKVPLAAGQWNASGGVAEGHEFRDGHRRSGASQGAGTAAGSLRRWHR
jgi:hypothetical protein